MGSYEELFHMLVFCWEREELFENKERSLMYWGSMTANDVNSEAITLSLSLLRDCFEHK